MKLALHRSIVFWSGLLVMGFVCWAWMASVLAPAMLYKGSYEIQNYDSTLYFGKLTDEFATADENPTWTKMDAPSEPEMFPGPSIPDGVQDGLLSFGVVLPHWLILLPVTALWLLLLFLRARRRNKSVMAAP